MKLKIKIQIRSILYSSEEDFEDDVKKNDRSDCNHEVKISFFESFNLFLRINLPSLSLLLWLNRFTTEQAFVKIDSFFHLNQGIFSALSDLFPSAAFDCRF